MSNRDSQPLQKGEMDAETHRVIQNIVVTALEQSDRIDIDAYHQEALEAALRQAGSKIAESSTSSTPAASISTGNHGSRPHTATDAKGELAHLLTAAASDLKEAGLSPDGIEVESSGQELWGYLWLCSDSDDMTPAKRSRAQKALQQRVESDANILPTTVNINYGNAGPNGIAVWWN